MENSLSISVLIPSLPMFASIFIFVLLASFNRTINRLTKPVSAIIGLSLLGSAALSSYYYLKNIEGDLLISNYFKILKKTNLVLHFTSLTEKITIFLSLLIVIIVGFLSYKLPRKKGYVSLIITIGAISSLFIFGILLIDFSAII